MTAFAKTILLALVLLAVPAVAHAADDKPSKILTIPPGPDVIKSLKKGDPAPFSGQLFDANTSMRWGFWLQQYQLHLDEDVQAEIDKCAVQRKYDAKVLKIEKKLRVTITSDLNTRLIRSETFRIQAEEDLRNPSFFRSLEFGVILGVVVTAGGIIAIAVAAK